MKTKKLKPSSYINFEINEPDGRHSREPQVYTGLFENWQHGDLYEDWIMLDFVYWGDEDYDEATQLKAAKQYLKQNIDKLYAQYESFRARDFWDWGSLDIKDELLAENGADWCPDISAMVDEPGQQKFLASLNHKETKTTLYNKLCKHAIKQDANYSGALQ